MDLIDNYQHDYFNGVKFHGDLNWRIASSVKFRNFAGI